MKKIILSILAVLAFGFTNAQETRFGLKAGVDLATSKVKFPGGTITGSDTGFYLGGFVQLGISEKFSLQPEVLFIAIPDFNVLSVPVFATIFRIKNTPIFTKSINFLRFCRYNFLNRNRA